MLRFAFCAAAFAACLPAAAIATGTVEVKFVQPEKYTDIGWTQIDRELAIGQVRHSLESLGSKLPDGETLRVDVLDVDLAGEIVRGGGRDLRVLKDRADGPRLTLHWERVVGGRTVQSGEDRLTELSYRVGGLTSQRLDVRDSPYVWPMLTRWYDERFTKANPDTPRKSPTE
jgi:hypothetical protein